MVNRFAAVNCKPRIKSEPQIKSAYTSIHLFGSQYWQNIWPCSKLISETAALERSGERLFKAWNRGEETSEDQMDQRRWNLQRMFFFKFCLAETQR